MELIASLVGPRIQSGFGRPQSNLNKQLIITLWYLGNQETFRYILKEEEFFFVGTDKNYSFLDLSLTDST